MGGHCPLKAILVSPVPDDLAYVEALYIVGYPQEGLHMQWDTPDPSFYTYSPCFPASSPFSSPPFTSPQINAVNGVSVAHGRDAPTHEFHFNNTHYIQAPGDDLPTTDIMTAALFDFHLGNQLGVQHQSTVCPSLTYLMLRH
jgi:hypothetical protein